jgi:hypothetical protein
MWELQFMFKNLAMRNPKNYPCFGHFLQEAIFLFFLFSTCFDSPPPTPQKKNQVNMDMS